MFELMFALFALLSIGFGFAVGDYLHGLSVGVEVGSARNFDIKHNAIQITGRQLHAVEQRADDKQSRDHGLQAQVADQFRNNGATPGASVTSKGWPNASTTGYGSTRLSPASTNSLDSAGTYNGLHFTGTVTISASNVTMRDCLITAKTTDWVSILIAGSGLTNIIIDHVEIAGAGTNSTQEGATAIGVSGDSQVSVSNSNIYEVGNGVSVVQGQVTVEDNYFHDFHGGPGSHINGIKHDGNSNHDLMILLRRNYLNIMNNNNDAVMIDNSLGPVQGSITIEKNYLGGGAYTVYVDGHFTTEPVIGVTIINNTILKGLYGWMDLNQGRLPSADYQVRHLGNVDAASGVALDGRTAR